METIKEEKLNKKDESSNKSETKSKILYKFKISENSSNKNNFMGKCFLINLNSLPEKKIQKNRGMRKLDKLPSILIKESSKRINTLSLEKSKSQSKKNIIHPTLAINNQISPQYLNTINNHSSYDQHKNIQNNINPITMPNDSKKNNIPDSFVKRINELYYPKLSTIKYLTNLFDDSEKNDLKKINLKKIKGNKRRSSVYMKEDYLQSNFIHRYRQGIKNRKVNSLDEKNNEVINNPYKLTKSQLENQLKKFHKLKIKMCKNKVNETINDLMKLKNKNKVYIEKFKKSCDFQFDDDLLI